MELAKLKNFKDLPAIDIADIQNSCFAQTINTFFGLLTQHVSNRVGQDRLNLFDFFEKNERYCTSSSAYTQRMQSTWRSVSSSRAERDQDGIRDI